MPNTYPSPSAAYDLGLGGEPGDDLRAQMDDEETRRKKRLLQLGGDNRMATGLNAMGGNAAAQLLGQFRGY